MPLGTEVGLGPGDIVFDEHPASRTKGIYHSSFRTMSIVAVWPLATGSAITVWLTVRISISLFDFTNILGTMHTFPGSFWAVSIYGG